jgi:hypothetical protein
MTRATPAQPSPATDQTLGRSIVLGVATAIPLMAGFLIAVVALAIGRQHAHWGAWLGMAASVGVLAGVFFGTWAGFVVNAHALDEADVPTRPRLGDSRDPASGRSGHS